MDIISPFGFSISQISHIVIFFVFFRVIVTWSKPFEGCVKVNVKGVCDVSELKGVVGCVMRDSSGDWMKGCKSMIGFCISVVAELWSIFYGMELTWDKEEKCVIVESDCEEAVNHVLTPDPNFYMFELVDMIRGLKGENVWELCEVVLVDSFANKPATALAENTMGDHGGIVELYEASSAIISLLRADN